MFIKDIGTKVAYLTKECAKSTNNIAQICKLCAPRLRGNKKGQSVALSWVDLHYLTYLTGI